MSFYLRRSNHRHCFKWIERSLYERHERLWGDNVSGYLGEHEVDVLAYAVGEMCLEEFEGEIGYFFNESLFLKRAWIMEETVALALRTAFQGHSQVFQPLGTRKAECGILRDTSRSLHSRPLQEKEIRVGGHG